MFTRWLTLSLAALGLALDMLGALLIVHLANGFYLPKGFEFVLLLFAASMALMFGGPGALSIDSLLAAKSTSRNR